jgi:hypothetical protein
LNKQPRFPNAERNGWGAAVKRFLPYAVFGAVAFSLASASHFNYFFRGYILLLEIQAGILLVYFLGNRLTKSKKQKTFQDSENF